jgi:subtilisin family serine protease
LRRAAAAAALGALVFAGAGAAAVARGFFAPNDPLASRQWYLGQDRAFDAWPDLPTLPGAGVKVAIVDSGIDGGHPEFAGRIAAAKSFVGGSALTDQQGHGTFVAGEIAAATGNGQGIAGIAFPAQLLIAKVVRSDRTISLDAEAAAIRWAVDRGARVVNLSLGGLRDPRDPRRDTYSPIEASAVDYAVRHGAVVVASVGNADQAPTTPWHYASYPAALPHVLGVSALGRDGSVPLFSNRDAIYDDIAAPGEEIFSTLPRTLGVRPGSGCPDPGYSDCGPDDFRHAEGTSFAAPQVAAGAALLFAADPELTSDQVTSLLEHSADDVNATTGCRRCPLLRDSLSGWGRLDVAKAIGALAGPLPAADRYETNDDAGLHAPRIWGRSRELAATLDYWDDPLDVYAVKLTAGTTLAARVQGSAEANVNLELWRPGTLTVLAPGRILSDRLARAARPGSVERIVYTAQRGGWYYVAVRIAQGGFGAYTLSLSKT